MLKSNNPYINKHLETEKKLNTKFELPICLMPVGPIPRGSAKSQFDMRYAKEYFDWIERRTFNLGFLFKEKEDV